jgi:hypothetical protein
VVDLAVLFADGGEAIDDLAVLRHQAGLFGPGGLGSNTAADHITVLSRITPSTLVTTSRAGCSHS